MKLKFKKLLLGISSLFFTVVVSSQNQDISGTVLGPSGVPLPGVTVLEENTQNGTQTDFDGKYFLEGVNSQGNLIFSYVGMTSQNVPVEGKAVIDIQLEQDAQALEQIVLIGYGSQSRKKVTTAVSKVEVEDFNQGVVGNPLDLVQGKIPGLSITRSAGSNNPNVGASFQLRGVTSLAAGRAPLIVIDGIPGGSLDLLQQNDIASFDVLKDGAAAAIYGTRGNNGVILITTKKGRKGVSKFEYSTFVSKDYAVNGPEFLNAAQHRALIQDGFIPENQDLGSSTDIYEELQNKDNFSQYHNFAISGGGERNTYRASLYYRNLDGIAFNNVREDFGARVSFNQKGLGDRLEFQSSIAVNRNNGTFSGSFGTGELNGRSNQFFAVVDWNPTAPIYAPFNDTQGEIQNQGRFGFYQPNNGFNPFGEYAFREYERKQITFSGDAKISYRIIDNLSVSVFGSYQYGTYNDRQYRSIRDWEQYRPDSAFKGTAYARKYNSLDYTQTFEPTINYNMELGENSFDLLGGYSYQYGTREQFSVSNNGFENDAFRDWFLGAGNAIRNTDLPRPELFSFKTDFTLIAYFTRLNYSYKDKYLLQASMRYEGSSRFGANNKWGSFPAVSAGWNISEEGFFQNVNSINNLKIRVGFGITGNQDIDSYESLITLGTGGEYPIFLDGQNNPTYYQTYGARRNPNPDLKWERKEELNIGIDFGLFSNKIVGAIDYYRRTTKDLLFEYASPQPPFIRDLILTNVGSIKNSGLELTLDYRAFQTENFRWDVSFAGSYQKNDIESLSNQQFEADFIEGGNIGNPGNLGNAIRNTEDGPIGNFFGKRFAGFTEDGKWLFFKEDGTTATSDEITLDDRTVIGNGLPKYYASLTNTFRYKNFDLTIFLRGKFDFDILNTVDLFYGNPATIGQSNVLTSALDLIGELDDTPQYSDYYIEKGDFVKLDNITLGYTFDLTNKKAFDQFRIFTTLRNAAVITGYSGRDPEVEDNGLYPGVDNRTFYPRTMTWSTGLNVTF